MQAYLSYLQFSSAFCPWTPPLVVRAAAAVNISCKHGFLSGSSPDGSYPVPDHTRVFVAYWKPWWLETTFRWWLHQDKNVSPMTQKLLLSGSRVVKNKGIKVERLHADRVNGQLVKKLKFRSSQNILPLVLQWHPIFSEVSPCNDLTFGYTDSLRVMSPVFRTSIPYMNDRLIKMSLEPKTLLDILLFIIIFYALYVCCKN